MGDQAEQLRQLMNQHNKNGLTPSVSGEPRVIVVASGKGGVGKTNFCVNFAIGLHEAGQRVVIIDADVGFANVEVLLGVRPKYILADIFSGQSIGDVLETSSAGISFLSGGHGLMDIHSMSEAEMERLLAEMNQLHEQFDVILIDCGGGLGTNTARMIAAADDLLLVTTPEPTAIADAYAMLKLLGAKGELPPTHLVLNRVRNLTEGKFAVDKIKLVSERFLNVQLNVLGYMYEDESVVKAVMEQRALMTLFPKSTAAQCVHQMVQNYLRVETKFPKKGVAGFIERLFKRKNAGGSLT